MSAYVEWMHTDHPFLSMEVVPAGTEVPDEGEFSTSTTALVIAADTIVVIEGEPKVLAEMLRQAADQLYID